MRIFYLFQIKEEVLKKYKYDYEQLYKILESIHYLKKEDILIGYNIFNMITHPFNKNECNNYIKESNRSNENYMCYNWTHTINDFYFDETTKMIIKNAYIIIKSNKNIPSFFNNIKNFNNVFVCDFNNHDFFVLRQSFYNS